MKYKYLVYIDEEYVDGSNSEEAAYVLMWSLASNSYNGGYVLVRGDDGLYTLHG